MGLQLKVVPVGPKRCQDQGGHPHLELLCELVHLGAPIEFISETLNRTEQELRLRGYHIGLPMKWFKPRSAA